MREDDSVVYFGEGVRHGGYHLVTAGVAVFFSETHLRFSSGRFDFKLSAVNPYALCEIYTNFPSESR
jgi:hypothetical protein